MTTRQLTAPEALRKIAEDLDAEQTRNGHVPFPFICNRTKSLACAGAISWSVSDRILDRIGDYLPRGRTVFADDEEGEDDVGHRIILCEWIALEFEEEGDRLVRRLLRAA